MSHTKRTCYECGYRDIQPNMYKKVISVESGSSNTGLTTRSLVGSLFSDKSAKEVHKYFLSPNKRTYKRNKTVYICQGCEGSETFVDKLIYYTVIVPLKILFTILVWALGAVCVLFLLSLLGII